MTHDNVSRDAQKQNYISKSSLSPPASSSSSIIYSLNDFYQKENKTLNFNVLVEDNCEQMNNEISFDSEKFSITRLEKTRPQETIDNLNEFLPEDENDEEQTKNNICHHHGKLQTTKQQKNVKEQHCFGSNQIAADKNHHPHLKTTNCHADGKNSNKFQGDTNMNSCSERREYEEHSSNLFKYKGKSSTYRNK